MASSTAKQSASSRKAPAKRGAAPKSPGAAIGAAAKDLEHDVAKAVRSELASLRKMFDRIQQDAQQAITKIEHALDPKKASKKAPAKKAAAKKAPAKKAAAKKAPAKR